MLASVLFGQSPDQLGVLISNGLGASLGTLGVSEFPRQPIVLHSHGLDSRPLVQPGCLRSSPAIQSTESEL